MGAGIGHLHACVELEAASHCSGGGFRFPNAIQAIEPRARIVPAKVLGFADGRCCFCARVTGYADDHECPPVWSIPFLCVRIARRCADRT